MRIGFLVIEDISSGLFRTQVFDLARSICEHDKNTSIRIFSFNRIWKIREHMSSLSKYKNEINNSQIKITYLPLLPPLRGVVGKPIISEVLVNILRYFSLLSFIYGSIDVWHARGYWTAMALSRSGKKSILFDPRSLWIQENQSAGNLLDGSKALQYWIHNEAAISKSVDHVTVVSEGMKDYFSENYGSSNISVIPISAESKFFNQSNELRIERRRSLGWSDNIIFVYSGSFGVSGINISALRKLFQFILRCENARLLILTEENDKKIISLDLLEEDFKRKVAVIKPKSSEVAEWLCAADVGVHALPAQKDSATRLGTKIVEYWATGLPVLINNHIGAACKNIVDNDYLGIVVDIDNDLPDINKIVDKIKLKPRELISEYAKNNFSSQVISIKFHNIYEAINGKSVERA